MPYRLGVFASVVLFAIYAVNSPFAGNAIMYAAPEFDTWVQTDWSGDGGTDTVSSPGAEYNNFFSETSTLRPFGEIAIGLDVSEHVIKYNVTGVRDLVIAKAYYVAAVDAQFGGTARARVLYARLDLWEDEWLYAPDFPQNGYGDTPLTVNALEFTADGYVFAAVTMDGGYAGLYRSIMGENGVTGPWEYLGGPGNPQDAPPTSVCTDVVSLYGLSDALLCSTGDTGRVFFYDGNSFTVCKLPDVDTVYRLSKVLPFHVKALTGPNGLQYFADVSSPSEWYAETWGALPSSDLYDSTFFGNYNFISAGGPAAVYRQVGTGVPVSTGAIPDSPESVYCLGYLGNFLIAGSGSGGALYVSRDYGDTWVGIETAGENTDFVNVFNSSAFISAAAFGCAIGNNGGLYHIISPKTARLESSALDAGAGDSTFGTVSWDVESNGGTVEVKVRSFNAFDDDGKPIAGNWANIEPVNESGDEMMELPAISAGDRYLQYGVFLEPSDTGESPIFKEVRLEYGSFGYGGLLPDAEVYAYPNPVRQGVCEIHYALAEDAVVKASIYDMKGRLVWSVSENGTGLESGQYIEWNVAGIAPGVFVLHVSATAANGRSDSVLKKVAVLK